MDARQRDVLIALIREYVDSAEPVGSRVLSKRHFPHLSPATIRNVMADLEEMGYLAQPHTSAGRIPTDKAYRFYVDSFPPPSPGGKPGGAALPTRRSGIDGFMERTSSHLSTVTRLTGLLLAPPLAQTVIARVDLMPLDRKSTRLNSSHLVISYAVFCLKKKNFTSFCLGYDSRCQKPNTCRRG